MEMEGVCACVYVLTYDFYLTTEQHNSRQMETEKLPGQCIPDTSVWVCGAAAERLELLF